MSLNNLIISQLTNVAGGAFDLDLAVENQQDKLIKEVSTQIQSKIPVPLPINVESALKGETKLPDNIISPEYISQAALSAGIGIFPLITLPIDLKNSINNTLDTLENVLNTTTQVTNTLQGSLILLQTPINTLDKLASTLDVAVTGLKVAVTAIKLAPFPTSVPPGIGIPANILTTLSDALDFLGENINKLDGPLSITSDVIGQINDILNPIIDKLNNLNKTLNIALTIVIFIRMLINFGSKTTQEQIDEAFQSSIINSIKFLDKISLSQNEISETSLPSSYKEFALVLEYNSENPYQFPQRRIKGTNLETNQIIYNTENGVYSFSSSVQILFDEIKFRIDSLERT